LATDDPLGLGGLLTDAFRAAQLMVHVGGGYASLLESILSAAATGVREFAQGDMVRMPPEYRLAFRELGLAIGLAGTGDLAALMARNPGVFGIKGRLYDHVSSLAAYTPLGKTIGDFWLDERSQTAVTWIEHREINIVMLATSLAPEGFLLI
jgi:hypothetical protein